MALRAILCLNGGEVFTVEAKRGRPPTSCTRHGGTGDPVQTFRKGSKAEKDALRELSSPVKERADYVQPPRAVPVRKVVGSDEGVSPTRTLVCAFDGHTWQRPVQGGKPPKFCPVHAGKPPVAERAQPSTEDDYPIEITLTGTYKPTTTPAEQRRLLQAAFNRPEQPKRRKRSDTGSKAVALVAPSRVDRTVSQSDDPEEDGSDHAGEFWCERGEHWAPRRSNRGQVPKICDEHKDDAWQREKRASTLESAEARGAAVADALIERLRTRGTDLASNSGRFQLQRWVKGRTWENLNLTADNWGVKKWLTNDDNAHQIKIKRVRWVPVNA